MIELEAEERVNVHAVNEVIFEDDELADNGQQILVQFRGPPLSTTEGARIARPKLQDPIVGSILEEIRWWIDLPTTRITPVAIALFFQLIGPETREVRLAFQLPHDADIAALSWTQIDSALARAPFEAAHPDSGWLIVLRSQHAPLHPASAEVFLPKFVDVGAASGHHVLIYYEVHDNVNMSEFTVELVDQGSPMSGVVELE